MDDYQRLRQLVVNGCARRGWSEGTVRTLFYSTRTLMASLGGFEAMCSAEPGDVRSWLEAGGKRVSTAYGYLRSARSVFDFLVEEGVIGVNPAAAIRVDCPSRDDVRLKPPADLRDLRMVFAYAKRHSATIGEAKSYLVLCLRIRCGVRYSAMARCRVRDLDLAEGGGCLLAPFVGVNPHAQVLHRIDDETAWAFRNYFAIRGPVSEGDPLIATDGEGFYCDNTLSTLVRDLFAECGLRASDYDLGKTMIELAYAEGANVVQASTLATVGLTLAAKVADELPSTDLGELHRRLLENLDSNEDVAKGMVRSEDIMAAVLPAYSVPYVKVVIGADGWARFEIPGIDDAAERDRA